MLFEKKLKESIMNLNELSERIVQLKPSLEKEKEQATIDSLIRPFFEKVLEYDMSDPKEVTPQFTCDIAKNADRVDYAIHRDGVPTILVECKRCTEDLDPYVSQAQKYFAAAKIKHRKATYLFIVLTNGIEYRFYSDLENQNIIDEKPFFMCNLKNIRPEDNEIVELFHKSRFTPSEAHAKAKHLKSKLPPPIVSVSSETGNSEHENHEWEFLEKVKKAVEGNIVGDFDLAHKANPKQRWINITFNKKIVFCYGWPASREREFQLNAGHPNGKIKIPLSRLTSDIIIKAIKGVIDKKTRLNDEELKLFC
jgi:hypothetical protein